MRSVRMRPPTVSEASSTTTSRPDPTNIAPALLLFWPVVRSVPSRSVMAPSGCRTAPAIIVTPRMLDTVCTVTGTEVTILRPLAQAPRAPGGLGPAGAMPAPATMVG